MSNIKKPIAVICLSPYSGGMEIDSIKLAKKLSNYAKVVMIAKSGYFIESKQNEYVGFNDIKLETISFKSNLGLKLSKFMKITPQKEEDGPKGLKSKQIIAQQNKYIKNILVTDSAGFVASPIIEELLKDENNNIIGIDNLYSGTKENLKNLKMR